MSYEQYRPSGFNFLAPVVKNLLIINGLLFFSTLIFKVSFEIDINDYLGLHFYKSELFRPHQFVTYMFMHGSLMHIFLNMLGLWMCGNILESHWGSKRFLIFYMVTGIGAGIIQMLFNVYDLMPYYSFLDHPTAEGLLKLKFINADPEFVNAWLSNPENTQFAEKAINEIQGLYKAIIDIPTVGASGSIFGILLAIGVLFPNMVFLLYFVIPIKAKYLVLIGVVYELYKIIINSPDDNVAHFAHLGGMLFGYILIKYWNKRSNHFY